MDTLHELRLSIRLGSVMGNSSQYAYASSWEQELASNAYGRYGIVVTARCRSASLAESTSLCLCELEVCFCWILVCCAFWDWGLMYRARSSGAQEALDTRVQPAGTQCPKYRLGFGGIGACRIERKWQEETRRARVTETRRWNDASQTSSTSATCQGTMRRWHDN